MNRRKFLGRLIGGLAGAAAARTWPFRVFSFPAVPRIDPRRIDMLDLSLWGRNSTPAEINSADFGLLVMPQMPEELLWLQERFNAQHQEFLRLKLSRSHWLCGFGFTIPENAKILAIKSEASGRNPS
jgi:hypothetical protein